MPKIVLNKIFFYLMSTLLFASCGQQNNGNAQALSNKTENSTIPAFWVAGALPDPYYGEAEEAIAKKYGYQIARTGCEVNDSLNNVVKENNEQLIKILQKKNPSITLDQLINEMQDYVSTTKSLEAVVMQMLKNRRKTPSPRKYATLKWQPATEKNWYLVDVYTYIPNKNNTDSLSYQMKINPITNDYLVKNSEGNWVEL